MPVRTSFLHLADTRLGYGDPSDPSVAERVAKQFRFAVDFAVDQRASFVVFSGDLFSGPAPAPETFQSALRGLTLLAEKNISAIAIRGQAELHGGAGEMSWHDLLAQQGLLATLETPVHGSEVNLLRWDRRAGAGSYVDMGRSRVFGLHYYGAMTGPMLQALNKAVSELDNREMDFRLLLLQAPLEHFSRDHGPSLSYADLLLLRRELDYVALGGCDERYEAEGWVYNPGAGGFYHVSVDTVVQPKHNARFVPFPAALAVARPHRPRPRQPRRELEAGVFEDLLAATSGDAETRALRADVLRLATESMWGEASSTGLRERLLERTARRLGEPAGAA
jgi:hypothetical protein